MESVCGTEKVWERNSLSFITKYLKRESSVCSFSTVLGESQSSCADPRVTESVTFLVFSWLLSSALCAISLAIRSSIAMRWLCLAIYENVKLLNCVVMMKYTTKNIYLFPNLLLISHAVYFPCPLVFLLLRLGTIIHDDPFATDPIKYMTQHCKLGKIPWLLAIIPSAPNNFLHLIVF